jgi:hypothetical protein
MPFGGQDIGAIGRKDAVDECVGHELLEDTITFAEVVVALGHVPLLTLSGPCHVNTLRSS